MSMSALEEYILKCRRIIRVVRHYRRFDDTIACGCPSTRIDTTSIEKHVTCLKCLKKVNKREEAIENLPHVLCPDCGYRHLRMLLDCPACRIKKERVE